MKRTERYRRQGEMARKSISEWPAWMQRSITPPEEEIPRLVEKPADQDKDAAVLPKPSGAEPSLS